MIVSSKRGWSRHGRFRRALPGVIVSMMVASQALASTHGAHHRRDSGTTSERGRVLALKGGGLKSIGGKGEDAKLVATRGGGLKSASAGTRRKHAQYAASRGGESDPAAAWAAGLDGREPAEPAAYPPAEDGHQTGLASWYGGKSWNGHRTSEGGHFDDTELTAAHATLPLGSMVRVTLASSERSVVVRINDRPGTRRRIIDLSRAAAERLGMLGAGVAVVTLSPL